MANKLFLIPTNIGDSSFDTVLPASLLDTIKDIRVFVVEEVRTARRFLRKLGYTIDFDLVTFHTLNEHTPFNECKSYLDNINIGDIGLLSEAGVPCVADPGSRIVLLAHEKGIEVVPLVGPSSILLSLMASGFNGQSFVFHGYLPVEKADRSKRLKELESAAHKLQQTQIFIETPYRNNQMLETICEVCNDNTLVCVSANLTQNNAFIKTMSVKMWRKQKISLHKQNAVFLMY